MNERFVGKVVRDGDELLLVLPDQLVKKFGIEEGDDLVPIKGESEILTLKLVRQQK